MKTILIAFMLVIYATVARAANEKTRILGTWESDKYLTAATLVLSGTRDQDRIQNFSTVFGKLILVISPKKLESYFPDQKDSRYIADYKVVSTDSDKLTLEYQEEGSIRQITFFFKGDDVIYTQTRAGSVSFDEHFKKKE
jgi:hypothetical protein